MTKGEVRSERERGECMREECILAFTSI